METISFLAQNKWDRQEGEIESRFTYLGFDFTVVAVENWRLIIHNGVLVWTAFPESAFGVSPKDSMIQHLEKVRKRKGTEFVKFLIPFAARKIKEAHIILNKTTPPDKNPMG